MSTDRIIKIAVLVIAVCALSFFLYSIDGTTRSVSGLTDPVQTNASGSFTKEVDDWNMKIEYKAKYKIDALVVHTKNYGSSKPADLLSPRDLALAWGNVAALNKEIDFNWSQSGRWYSWNVRSYEDADKVGGMDYINQHSSNNHIIPADDSVKDQLMKIKKGDNVEIEGYLVSVSGSTPNNETFSWNSSLSRGDTGDGACEIIYATKLTKKS